MDTGTMIAVVASVASAIGGFAGGRRTGKGDAVSIAVDTVELLQAQVDSLKEEAQRKETLIADLQGRVEVLEGLVTQRAEVAAVHDEVKGVRVILEKVAEKVGA